MVDLQEIVKYVGRAVDEEETKELKEHLREIRKKRMPFYLDSEDFERILKWKLRGQYNRNARHIRKNNESLVKEITLHAFNVSSENDEYELRQKISILCKLDGVGIGVASAILALVFPEKYCVIDFRGWRYLFGEYKRTFTTKEYIRYLNEMRKMADKLNLAPQEVDLAVWACDMDKNRK